MTEPLRLLIDAIVRDDRAAWLRMLEKSPSLAVASAGSGADRNAAEAHFYTSIRHYVYGGDTALHMAAAACNLAAAERLIDIGAGVRARNRRGAEPLHYAVDAGPDVPDLAQEAQTKIIAALVNSGADPNARDKSGVSPLHRAVRNRSLAAVVALLDLGADPHAPNGRGSTPLRLANIDSGKAGSGAPEARAAQAEILRRLEARGAR